MCTYVHVHGYPPTWGPSPPPQPPAATPTPPVETDDFLTCFPSRLLYLMTSTGSLTPQGGHMGATIPTAR